MAEIVRASPTAVTMDYLVQYRLTAAMLDALTAKFAPERWVQWCLWDRAQPQQLGCWGYAVEPARGHELVPEKR